MRMTSWHDIGSLANIGAEAFKGLEESRAIISSLLDNEIKAGIPSHRIVLGGFSQGAGLSVFTGYQYPQQLAGIVGLSGYLPYQGDFSKVLNKANVKTPALLCHGDSDTVVDYKWGAKCAKTLQEHGVPATFTTYPDMSHGACEEEIEEVLGFLQRTIPAVVPRGPAAPAPILTPTAASKTS